MSLTTFWSKGYLRNINSFPFCFIIFTIACFCLVESFWTKGYKGYNWSRFLLISNICKLWFLSASSIYQSWILQKIICIGYQFVPSLSEKADEYRWWNIDSQVNNLISLNPYSYNLHIVFSFLTLYSNWYLHTFNSSLGF